MIAYASNPSLTRHTSAFVIVVANQVDLSIGAGARPTPHADFLVVLDHHIPHCALCTHDRWSTYHFAEGPFSLAPLAIALDTTIAGNTLAHIALITNLINASIRARTPAAPNANRGAVLEIDHIPRLGNIIMVVIPLQGI